MKYKSSILTSIFTRKGGEGRFTKIINENNNFEYENLLKSNNSTNNNPWGKAHPLIFIPADSLPSSDNWLKEKKWIWRNESDWNKYMQHIKYEKMKK